MPLVMIVTLLFQACGMSTEIFLKITATNKANNIDETLKYFSIFDKNLDANLHLNI